METNISRRGFLTAAACFGAAGALGLSGCGSTSQSDNTQADTNYEDEADFVVLGTGAAGLSAAITIYDEGLGTAMILEASSEEFRGGNSRVCGQGVFCPTSVEGAIAYQTDLNGSYEVDASLVKAWAENICENKQWLEDVCGADMQEMGGAEFPEAASSDAIVWYAHEGGGPNAACWQLLMDKAESFDVPIHYDARAVKLIVDEASGEVRGVVDEEGRAYKAKKGVILSCGGFENNQEMMNGNAPIGFAGMRANGTWYNRGDGVTMARSVGADFWHMNNFSGNRISLQIASKESEVELTQAKFGAKSHDYLFVGPDGKRFIYEETVGQARHGKLFRAGTWADATLPETMYAIFGQASFDAANIFTASSYASRTEAAKPLTSNAELLDAGIIERCETVADISRVTGIDEVALQGAIDEYNVNAAAGSDPDFHRGEASTDEGLAASHVASADSASATIEAFPLELVELPCYCVRLFPGILNTQGGPKRSALGEVLDTQGAPIPRLYAAGELGTVYSYKYNLGGNFSEAISSGRVAARNAGALSAWDAD